MHVLGGLHQLGEAYESVPRLGVAGACHLGKDRAIPLDDKGPLDVPYGSSVRNLGLVNVLCHVKGANRIVSGRERVKSSAPTMILA